MRTDMAVGAVLGVFVAALPVQPASAVDVGVGSSKLVFKQNTFSKVRLTIKDPAVMKGAAGDPQLLSGSVELIAEPDPLFFSPASGTQPLESEFWKRNDANLARYAFIFKGSSIVAPASLRVVVRPGKALKVSARRRFFINDGGGIPPPPTAVTVVVTIENGNDASTTRMCTRFDETLGSTLEFDATPGINLMQLRGRDGVPTSCPASPSGAFLDPAA